MRIACPSCETAYEVPESVLSSHRKLRCARCGTEWNCAPDSQPDPAPEAAPPQPVVSAPQTTQNIQAADPIPAFLAAPAPLQQGSSGQRRAVLIAWAASLLLLIGLGWSAIAWRHPIQNAWPASTRLYATLGYR